MDGIPSARELFKQAIREEPEAEVNRIHERIYELMLYYKRKYYEGKVGSFLREVEISKQVKEKLTESMLKPVIANGVEYSNFMEEAARRISQSIQPLSGKSAELCVERELLRNNLLEDMHFVSGRRQRTDFILYYPDIFLKKKEHRIEVKNVKLRERAVRGLSFDGDSLVGFFDSAGEFSPETIGIINSLCAKTRGYFYIPPSILRIIDSRGLLSSGTRLRPNTQFGRDMAEFCKTGKL